MSLDISLLASTVVSSFLLPYAKLSVQKIAEKAPDSVSEQAAQEVVALTKAVWEKVKTVFTGADTKRLEQFKETAGSNKDLIEAILKEKIQNDYKFALELEQLVSSSTTLANNVSTGSRIMKAFVAGIVDMRDANFQNAKDIKITGVSIKGDTKNFGDTEINTGGGAYVAGDVNTSNGNFIGRDQKDLPSSNS